nr:family 43 glycosylhydrolase [uncultured Acetatifactor sp.]
MKKYFCNPINFTYQYQFNQKEGGFSLNREAADPSMILFRGKYYLFPSMTRGFLVSEDMASWKLRPLTGVPLYDYAPDVRAIGDWMYFCASRQGEICDFYRTKDPESGVFEKLPGTFDFWDPNLFLDDDGRLYFYWGCSNMTPIWGVELDPETMERIGEPVALIHSHKTEYGYERTGEEHHYDSSSSPIAQILRERIAKASGCRPEDVADVTPAIEAAPESCRPLLLAALSDNPYIEGAWMTKHDGRYYLQYAAPGTQYNIYNDGVCVSESPLGPFTACPNNPSPCSPGGFLPGAGHGSTMEDRQGNWWHASTMRLSRNHDFERRIGIWPAGFDADGELFCNQRYGDWPQSVTGERKDPWAAPEWMLLSYGKTATASSCDCPKKDASHVVDENAQTWWKAAGEDAAPWLLVDLGRCCRVHAVQINFADDVETVTELPRGAELTGGPGRGRYIEERSFATRWFLETSTDGEHWFEMENWRHTDTDLPHNLVVWEDGLPATYIRLTVIETPYHRPACISGLRVFGRSCGNAPDPVTEAEAARLDGMSMNVTWKEVSSSNEFASWNHAAMGYEVLWGHAPEKLYHSYRVFGRTQVEIRALMANVERYYVRIDAFNECGITQGKVFPVGGAVWQALGGF